MGQTMLLGGMGQTTSSTTHALIAPLSHPWLQYIGTISYSLYLAHWPVIVVYPFATGRAVDGALADGVAVLAASWALAHACKWGWEDRFRFVGSDTIGGDLGKNGRSFTVITAKAGAPSVGSVKQESCAGDVQMYIANDDHCVGRCAVLTPTDAISLCNCYRASASERHFHSTRLAKYHGPTGAPTCMSAKFFGSVPGRRGIIPCMRSCQRLADFLCSLVRLLGKD